MPKGLDYDKIVAEALRRLGQSGNKNRANWAATLEEKYGGNIVEARKATSRGRNRNKKKDAK
jgi:hypothetical protein